MGGSERIIPLGKEPYNVRLVSTLYAYTTQIHTKQQFMF